jgi:hypothetical protein
MGFTFTVKGLSDLQSKFGRIEQTIRDGARDGIAQISYHCAERAELNAPIDEGVLRAQIQPLPISVSGDLIEGGVQSVRDKRGIDVAYEMHEKQYPAPDFKYSLGPRTMQQPKTEEGGPGGLFIWRVLHYHYSRYAQVLGDAVIRAVSGGAPQSHTLLEPNDVSGY